MADDPAIDRADLVFRRPWADSADVVFGAAVAPGAAPNATLDVGGALPGLGPLIVNARGRRIGSTQLPGLGVCELVYDNNVDRTGLDWQRQHAQPAQPIASSARSAWELSDPIDAVHRHRAQLAEPFADATRAAWQTTQRLDATARQQAQPGQPTGTGVRGAFQRTITLRASARQRLQAALPALLQRRTLFQSVIVLQSGARSSMQPGAPVVAHWVRNFANAQPLPQRLRSAFQLGRYPIYASHPPPPVEPPDDHLCYDPATLGQLVFRDPWTGSGDLVFVCRPAGGTVEPPGATIVILRRRTYIVINDLQIRTVPGGDLLPALDSGFSMQLEQGSWTWGFQFAAHAAALPLLQPGPAGDPAELEVIVNGQPFRMLVEGIARSVKFPRAVVNVRGRGLAALLDAPRAPVQSFAQPAAVNAQQLALDVLTTNGVSMGWTVDWRLTDWQIPAGTWAHQGTWISAINDIASAVGGYVQPHDTARTLRILPAWPMAAWNLASATPDIELPAGIATIEEVTWADKPDYDALYMQGEPGNKLYYRNRAGTPGDNPAPMAVHALLVDAPAAQQRATAALSETGRQVEQRLNLIVLPETGVIKPGALLRYTDDANVARTGIVRTTQVQQSGPRIEQSLTVQAPA